MEQSGEPCLKKRQITLKDGRYMIFYTFEDEMAPSPDRIKVARDKPKPQAEEKPRV